MSDLENSREEFINEIGAIVESLRGFGMNIDGLTELSRRNLSEEQRQAIITRQFEREKKEWNEKTNKILSENATALVNFGRSLTAAPGSFAPLNAAVNLTQKAFTGLVKDIPFVGGLLKGLGEAAGETAKFMIDAFQNAYGTFERLSDVGVVNTFEDMKRSSEALGLTFADNERVLTKASKDLAMFGGSATMGRKMFEMIGVESDLTRRQMQRLGISAAEVGDFQLSYIAQQQRYTKGQLKDVNSLREGSEKYIKELDTLSKLTGVSRKQLQTEQEARLRDARYRAGIASLGEKPRQEIDKFLGILKQTAPTVEEGFKDLIASGGVPITEASKQVALTLQQAGLDSRDVALQLRNGSMTGYQAFQLVAKSAGAAANATEKLTSIVGDNTIISKLFVEMRELEAKKASMTETEYNKQQNAIKNAIEATKGQNAALADTKVSMYNAGRNLELLATSSEFATKTMKFFAEGIEWVTEKMYEITGKDLPEHIKARQEERKALEEENNARKKLTELNQALPEEEKKLIDLRYKFETETDERKKKILQDQIKYSERQVEFLKNSPEMAKSRAEAAKVIEEANKKTAEKTKKRKEAEAAAGLGAAPTKPESAAITKEQQLVDDLKKQLEQRQAVQGLASDDREKLLREIKILETQVTDAKEKGNQEEVKRLQGEIQNKQKDVDRVDKRIEKANEEARKVQEKYDEAVRRRDRAILEEKAGVARPAGGKAALSDTEKLLATKTSILGKLEGTEKDWGKKVADAKKVLDEATATADKAKTEAATGIRPGEGTLMPSYDRQRTARLADERRQKAQAEYEKAQGEQSKAKQSREAAQKEINSLTEQVNKEKQQNQERDEKQRREDLLGDLGIDDIVTFTDNSGSKENFNQLQPEVSEAFTNMAKEYFVLTGKKLQINSSYRSPEKQKELWEESIRAGREGRTKEGWPIAKPGSSKHETGRALDLNSDQVRFLRDKDLLEKYGFSPLDNDPPHIFKMKDGGVIEARPGGTRVVAAEAGMNEAYVPLPNGKSIPVDIKNNFLREFKVNLNELSESTDKLISVTNDNMLRSNNTIAEKLDRLHNTFSSSVNKLSEMISLLESSKNIQKSLLEATN